MTQSTDGGVAVMVEQLARAGLASGDDVTVVCPSRDNLGPRLVELGIRWVDLPMRRNPSWRDLVTWCRLRPLFRAADVVHLHSSKAGAVGRLATIGLGRRRPRVVFTPHAWSWYVGGLPATVYRRFERRVAPMCDAIVTVSPHELQEGRAVLGAEAPLRLIENGVDVAALECCTGEPGGADAPLLVHVGRFSVQKAQDRSIRALAQLTDHTVRLRLVGHGPQRESLERQAEREGVRDRVEFVGYVDPQPHLCQADLVLLPSRWEGLSLSMLEGMALGKAVIASDCGGSDALGDCGVLVDHANDDVAIAQLVEQITRLLADPEQRRELGERAKRRVREKYSSSQTIHAYQELWRELAAQ